MKYQIFKAVDKIDGELSLFMFDDCGGYTVIDYSEFNLGQLVNAANDGSGCHWDDDANEKSRRDDMIDAMLLCEVEK